MRFSNAVMHLVIAFASAGTLAGCSSGSSPTLPTTLGMTTGTGNKVFQSQITRASRFNGFLGMRGGVVPGLRVTTPSFMDPGDVGKPLVFLSTTIFSNGYSGVVGIYRQARENKMVGQITGLTSAADIATDVAGDLYVVDYIASNVTVFAPPYTSGPKLTLHPVFPFGIAVSSQGVVGVTVCFIQSGRPCGPEVVFYAPGSAAPCATVLLYGPSYSGGVGLDAFDGKGNLYVEAADSAGTFDVAKIDGGCNAKTYQTLTLGNTIFNNISDIKIDKSGHIAIGEETSSGSYQIDTYNPPKGGTLGDPISITPLVGNGAPNPFAFVASGHSVWLSDWFSVNPYASEYAYPAGGSPEKTINSDTLNSLGVAVTPALVP